MKVMNMTKTANKSLGKIERCKPRAANFQKQLMSGPKLGNL